MFAWICPKCGKEIPPQYDGCPEWCPEYDKQKAYLKNTERTAIEATNPVLKNLVQVEGKPGGAVYNQSSAPPPVPDEETTQVSGPRIRPAAAAVAYEEGVPEYNSSNSAKGGSAAAPMYDDAAGVRNREMNPLLVTLLATIVFLALGYAGYQYYENSKGVPGASSGIVMPGTPAGGHSLNRVLSVTGLRFVPGKNKQLEARFLIVNSSAAQTPKFSGMVYVRPKEAAEDETPILTFALTDVDLGPYESREMQAPLQTSLRPYEMPDGSLIRTDLAITSPEE